MGLRGQLLFFLFCFHCSWSIIFVVPWDSSGTSVINNYLEVAISDIIRFNCTNEVSNVFRTNSEQAFNQCDTAAAGSSVGHCQPDVQVVSFFILPPEYQAGMRYYLYSTHENECSDGVKLSIDVIAAHSTSSAVQPTTAASSPMDPTGTSTPGAVIGSTGTVTGSTGTVTGSTTSSSFTTSASPTPTVGGSDEGGSSFLEKLPFREYFLVIVAIVFIILLLLIVLPITIMCFRKRRGSGALVKPYDEEEKCTYRQMDSAVEGKNEIVKPEEKPKLKSELKRDEKIEGRTTKDKVEIKEADNGNTTVSFKRTEEKNLSPYNNLRRPPLPPSSSSNAPKTTSNNSVPKTSSDNSVPKTATSNNSVPKRSSAPSTTTDPKSLPASTTNKQMSSGPSHMSNRAGPKSLPAVRRPAPTPTSLPAGNKRQAPPPPST